MAHYRHYRQHTARSTNQRPTHRLSRAIVSVSLAAFSVMHMHAEEQPTKDIASLVRLEAHGFVSFGYFRTWGNNYLTSDSIDGSTDFYEAAMNASMRPWDRVRIGAQLYLRDLGRYENGDPRLDWAFAEFTFHQSLVVQAGRVKVPAGLYNDLQDNDPARTPVFLPQSLYPIRLRDGQVSVDGAKISGFVDDIFATEFDYTIFGGTKIADPDSAYAQSVSERLGGTTSDIQMDALYGGMLHWYTPIDGLAARITATNSDDIEITAQTSFGSAKQYSDVQAYVFGLEWQTTAWTLATEYAYSRNKGYAVNNFGSINLERDYNAGYFSATHHATSWLDLYGAIEYQRSDTNGNISDAWTYVAALNLMPLRNWSIKAEFQLHDGEAGILSSDNPQGVSNSWQVLAVKTTVDF